MRNSPSSLTVASAWMRLILPWYHGWRESVSLGPGSTAISENNKLTDGHMSERGECNAEKNAALITVGATVVYREECDGTAFSLGDRGVIPTAD